MLNVTTTHMKEGWIQRNGITVSDQATMSEHYIKHDNYLTAIFVINDPADSGPGTVAAGLNWIDYSNTHAAYVASRFLPGTHKVDVDGVTGTFSHELAEGTAYNIVVNDPGHLKAGGQIADNEPEWGPNGYEARIDGVLVQAYWSTKDSAWIVPDGSTTQTVLNPIWGTDDFTGFYNNAGQKTSEVRSYADGSSVTTNYNTSGVVTQTVAKAGGATTSGRRKDPSSAATRRRAVMFVGVYDGGRRRPSAY